MKKIKSCIAFLAFVGMCAIHFNFTSIENLNDRAVITKVRESQTCAQVATYNVKLKTVAGSNISPSAVSPSTNYRIDITFSGTYPGSTNVGYCTVLAYGFNVTCEDSSSGSTTLYITTDATLPPFGIIGVVGPTDCTGSLASASASTTTQKQVI